MPPGCKLRVPCAQAGALKEASVADQLTLRRVANGWVILPGGGTINEFTHVAATPDELAEHVRKWAQAQMGRAAAREGE